MLENTQSNSSRGRKVEPTSRSNLAVLTTDDASKTLLFQANGVTFHSASGAATETQHVYLNSSGLPNRWAAGLDTSVLEIGLGTSMTLLMTVDQAIAANARLFYLSLETDWLEADIIKQLDLQKLLKNPQLVESWLTLRDNWDANQNRAIVHWSPHELIRVELHLTGANEWNAEPFASRFDAIFFDPFSYDTSPELWSPKLFAKMKRMLNPSGCLVTYSCSRIVRTNIETAGLIANKVKGPPGGKRESLVVTHPT